MCLELMNRLYLKNVPLIHSKRPSFTRWKVKIVLEMKIIDDRERSQRKLKFVTLRNRKYVLKLPPIIRMELILATENCF